MFCFVFSSHGVTILTRVWFSLSTFNPFVLLIGGGHTSALTRRSCAAPTADFCFSVGLGR